MNKPALPKVVKFAGRFAEAAHAATTRMRKGKNELAEYFDKDFKSLVLATSGVSKEFLDIVGETGETLVAGLDTIVGAIAELAPAIPIGRARKGSVQTHEHT